MYIKITCARLASIGAEVSIIMARSRQKSGIIARTIVGIVLLTAVSNVCDAELRPRVTAAKPSETALSADASIAYVVVKFSDNEQVRLRGDRFVSRGGNTITAAGDILAPYFGNRLSRLFVNFSEEKLNYDRISLQQKSNHELADLNGYYRVEITDPDEAEGVINSLNDLEMVELAYFAPEPGLAGDVDPPTPDFQSNQDYREAAPGGIDADYANTLAGGDGAGIKIVDIEGGWNFHHEDLDGALGGHIGGVLIEDPYWKEHGTAVIGELIAGDNGFGVTGICPGAEIGMISINTLAVSDAIYMAADNLEPGDIILIELHAPGPHYDFEYKSDQRGYVCMEYFQAEFDAILYSWAKGITVVEAAGNGMENFDDTAIYGQLFDTTFRNSHAIIVGAGEAPVGADRERLLFSNFGERVNLQGYGRDVYTTGYGYLFDPDNDPNQYYTGSFSGTSSASPMIVGAVACLQGYMKANVGTFLSTDAVRDLLVATGSPQMGDTLAHIGPRPDLLAALGALGVPMLAASPPAISLDLPEGDAVTVDLWLHNRSPSATLDYDIVANDSLPFKNIFDWLQVSPAAGSIGAADSGRIDVDIDASNLPSQTEIYAGGLEISWGDSGQPLDSLHLVRVLLTVTCGQPQICGDVNQTDGVTRLDADFIVEYIADRGEAPVCPMAADCDGSVGITMADVVYLAEYLSGVGPDLDCEPSDTYDFPQSYEDTLFLPAVSNVPDEFDSLILPVLTALASATDGFYFPIQQLGAGSNEVYYLEEIDDHDLSSIGSGLNHPDGISVVWGVERWHNVNFTGRNELFSLVYRRKDSGHGNIVSQAADRNELWRYAVEKNGDLYRPVIETYDLGSSFPVLSENEMYFTTIAGVPVSDTFDVVVSSTGEPFSWEAEVSDSWIIIDNYSGTTGQMIRVTVDQQALAPGLHTGEVAVFDTDNSLMLKSRLTVDFLLYPETSVVINVPDDYSTIQEAIDVSVFGDTVLVAPGQYEENLDFLGKAIKLMSSAGAEATHLIPSETGSYIRMIDINNTYTPGAELMGFSISGFEGGLASVVYVENSDSVMISQNIFYDNFPDGGFLSPVIEMHSSDVNITWNFFHNNDGTGYMIDISDSSTVEVINNTMVGNRKCIGGENDIAGIIENNLITGSTLLAVAGDFLQMDCNNLWDNHYTYTSGATAGPNDINADPLYCCASKGNFHISPDSPCLPDMGECGELIGAYGIDFVDCDCFDMTPFAVDIGYSPVDQHDAVVSYTPQIFWTFFDTMVGAVQQAYQIEAGTDTLWDTAEMWLSGSVPSGQPEATYDGNPLEDHTTYHVRIRLYNGIDWGDWMPSSFSTHYSTLVNVPADKATIQEGIDAAFSGDTVLVAPGTYHGSILFTDRSIVVTSSGGAGVTTIVAGTDSGAVYILEEEDGKPSEFSGFTVTGAGGAGIYASRTSPRIMNNIVTGNICDPGEFTSGGILLLYTDSALVSGNILYGNTTTSVNGGTLETFGAEQGTVISRNLFYDNESLAEIAITIGDSEDSILVHNNVIAAPVRHGIDIIGASCNARNNVIFSSPYYAVFHDVSFPGRKAAVEYNCFYDNAENFNLAPGIGNIYEEALFIDAAGHDFRLQPESPCIDAGDPDDIFIDIDGSRNDIGAIPYVHGVPFAGLINYGPEAIGNIVDTLAPTIYWTYFDSLPGPQVKYTIQVGTDDDWSAAEMWNSGEVESSANYALYNGQTLSDYTTYYLRMRVFNGLQWGDWGYSWFITHLSNTIHIPADFATIQEGIDIALSGDTVLAAPGTYVENLDFRGKAVTLTSSGGLNETFLQPEFPDSISVSLTGIGDGDVQFSGFTIFGGGQAHTLFISEVPYVVIRDNIFKENIPSGRADYEVISCRNTSLLITRNIFYGNGGNGCIAVHEGVAEAQIINNTIDGNRIGINLAGSESDIVNNIVSNSTVRGIAAAVLPDQAVIDYNDVWNNADNYDPEELAGEHDISADPEFTDPPGHDYYLMETSPCIDAGDPDTSLYEIDDTPCDIGALPRLRDFPLAFHINYGPEANLDTVSTMTPEIYWTYFDTASTAQARYHIQVGTDEDWTAAEMWDTGEIESSDTSVIYGGAALADLTTYYLRIRVHNGSDWGSWKYGSFFIFVGYVCGDANTDFNISVADAVYLIVNVFKGGPDPVPYDAGDANCDGMVNVGDIVRLIDYVFRNGEEPCCPE